METCRIEHRIEREEKMLGKLEEGVKVFEKLEKSTTLEELQRSN